MLHEQHVYNVYVQVCDIFYEHAGINRLLKNIIFTNMDSFANDIFSTWYRVFSCTLPTDMNLEDLFLQPITIPPTTTTTSGRYLKILWYASN